MVRQRRTGGPTFAGLRRRIAGRGGQFAESAGTEPRHRRAVVELVAVAVRKQREPGGGAHLDQGERPALGGGYGRE